MPPTQRDHRVTPPLRSLLDRLRRRIRAFIWGESTALAVIWVAAMFWIGLALDYLPVLAGSSEMPKGGRLAWLILSAGGLIWILVKQFLSRMFVPMGDGSLAIILERYFPAFDDSLLTTVQNGGCEPIEEGEFGRELLAHTRQQAEQTSQRVALERVFNYRRLARQAGLAGLLLLSIAGYAWSARDAFGTWSRRLFLLSDETWPRRTHLESIDFRNGVRKVARGTDVPIRVRADANRPTPPPETCTIAYRTEEGQRGRVVMSRVGGIRDGYQYYTYTGKPFSGIVSGVQFDIIGNDHRLRNNRVEVVESPTVIGVDVHCQMPDYTQLATRTQPWQPGLRLPKGSRIQVRAHVNKSLQAVAAVSLAGTDDAAHESAITEPLTATPQLVAPREFTLDLPRLQQGLSIDLMLTDTDGVTSLRPFRLTLGVLDDSPPQWTAELRGIGTAITTQAEIPLVGSVTDDYGVDRAWYELEIAKQAPRVIPCLLDREGKVSHTLDLQRERDAATPLRLDVGTQLTLTVKADDFYDGPEGKNVGQGERYELSVVTPDQLQALLDDRELGLRRRFEQLLVESRETRDSLIRMRSQETPAELTPDNNTQQRLQSLRLLRVERALQFNQRAAQEMLGLAAAFQDIIAELRNNRIAAQDREKRLETSVVAPLQKVARQSCPPLDVALNALLKQLHKPGHQQSLTRTIDHLEQIILDMEQILENMLELESFNELVDMVRSLIAEQESLLDQTKKLQRKQTLDLLK